ncbi:lasso peptide biosynthesis B2 protein [Actinomadura sp. WMMB 499]|uniref:lasso peptide biosynthesis B2 protein n=1 Tax=Actinomadura sp. WMMB 499 TaxID=1219491 RepID=UPI0012452498|nr:lasso peptide biosynthesis B2 protein [Actinomadura sp. WMMB 499]QFG20276.1 lasso peptide biosynthesis B2 protein [Actinomadura sp. WMMB 499]
MTMPVTLERPGRVPLRRRAAARPAVALAALLERLPPRRMRRALLVIRRGTRPATLAQATAAREAVVAVSVRCAGQGCLRRSLAVVLLCRMGGTWPDWCTGVRTEPFRAHAWVEAEGTAAGEHDDMLLYAKTMTVPARARKGR